MTIGPARTLRFFSRRDRARGIISFFFGVAVVLFIPRFAFFGLLLQLYGIVYLFGQFFPIVAESLKGTPVVGSILSIDVVDRFLKSFGNSGGSRRAPV